MLNNITATDSAITAILKAKGIAVDELPMSVQARLFHRLSEEAAERNTTISLVDLEGSLAATPPSGPAEANARYGRYIASINDKNHKFWAGRA